MAFPYEVSTDDELLKFCQIDINILKEVEQNEKKINVDKEEISEISESEKSIILAPTEYNEHDRIFQSPLHIFYKNFQNETSPVPNSYLFFKWKDIQNVSKKKFFTRQEQLLHIHRVWEKILSQPQQLDQPISISLSQNQNSNHKKKAISQDKEKPPFNLEKFSRALKEETKKNYFYDRKSQIQYNLELLCPVEEMGDLLLSGPEMAKFSSYFHEVFQRDPSFVQVVTLIGDIGIGKKTFLNYLFGQMLYLDVTWISLLDADSYQKFENKLQMCPLIENHLHQRVNQMVLVISDCDDSNRVELRKIQQFIQRLQEKKPVDRQIVILFVTCRVLHTIKFNSEFRVYAAKHEAYQNFYFRIRNKIREVHLEPLEWRSFPSLVASDPSLLLLLEKHDIRALLGFLSFRWMTMDALRTFTFSNVESPEVGHDMETILTLNSTSIVNMIIRRCVPASLRGLVKKGEEFSVRTLHQLLNVNQAPPLFASGNSCFKIDPRTMMIVPLMILVHALAFVFGFNSWKAMRLALKNLVQQQPQQCEKEKEEDQKKKPPKTEEKGLREVVDKLFMYLKYRSFVVNPDLTLLKDLVMGTPLPKRFDKGFKVKYFGGRQEIQDRIDSFHQVLPIWKRSFSPEEQVFLYQLNAASVSQYFSHLVKTFDGKEAKKPDFKFRNKKNTKRQSSSVSSSTAFKQKKKKQKSNPVTTEEEPLEKKQKRKSTSSPKNKESKSKNTKKPKMAPSIGTKTKTKTIIQKPKQAKGPKKDLKMKRQKLLDEYETARTFIALKQPHFSGVE